MMAWTTKTVTDDGQRVEIERIGPYRWVLRHLTNVIANDDHHPQASEHRTRRAAIAAAEERWAIHPRRWQDEP